MTPEWLAVARVIHVLAVILWIGGVGMVTTVLLPTARREADPAGGVKLFLLIEEGFSLQAKLTVLLAGLSGFAMLGSLHGWERLLHPGASWWVLPMVLIWLLFTVVLFILEPLVMRHRLPLLAARDPAGLLGFLARAHRVLLTLSLIAAGLAVAGAHGLL